MRCCGAVRCGEETTHGATDHTTTTMKNDLIPTDDQLAEESLPDDTHELALYFRDQTNARVRHATDDRIELGEIPESGGASMLPGGMGALERLNERWPEHEILYINSARRDRTGRHVQEVVINRTPCERCEGYGVTYELREGSRYNHTCKECEPELTASRRREIVTENRDDVTEVYA